MAEPPENSLRLNVERRGPVAVVRVQGSVTMGDADDFRGTLEGLADVGARRIVLDLGAMDFICSAGLGAIISAHLKTRRNEGHVLLVNPQSQVKGLLETTRLTKLFPIHPSVEQALSA
jgi:anti-sigma B factor antagonist